MVQVSFLATLEDKILAAASCAYQHESLCIEPTCLYVEYKEQGTLPTERVTKGIHIWLSASREKMTFLLPLPRK